MVTCVCLQLAVLEEGGRGVVPSAPPLSGDMGEEEEGGGRGGGGEDSVIKGDSSTGVFETAVPYQRLYPDLSMENGGMYVCPGILFFSSNVLPSVKFYSFIIDFCSCRGRQEEGGSVLWRCVLSPRRPHCF